MQNDDAFHTQVTIILDMDLLATKIIVLKDTFPSANVLKILSNQPRMLLQPAERLKSDAEQVCLLRLVMTKFSRFHVQLFKLQV